MGRRSINTTKSGKYMNPTDQARKEARKKELKKNKKQRQMVRNAVLKGKDPAQLIDEMEKIDEMEYNVYQPSPLNEKVLREKRKKLKETLDRVLRLYHTDDPELWSELKRKEVDYEKRRNKKVQYFESVKHAQSVQIDEIPLPQMNDTPLPLFNLPRIPIPGPPPLNSGISFIPPPPLGILKKSSLSSDSQSTEKPKLDKSKKVSPGCPPGPPPSLLSMMDLDSDYEEEYLAAAPTKAKKSKIRFSEETKIGSDSSNEKSNDKVGDEEVHKPTSLQQRMLALSGQNIDEFMKEMENVQKKKEKERAAEIKERLRADKDNQSDASEDNNESDDSDDDSEDDDANVRDELINKKFTDKIELSSNILHQTSTHQITLPSGPPPPPMPRIPSMTMFRPPPLRPTGMVGSMRIPGPPPGRPPGLPRMGIRMPPGPPPGMPPQHIRHKNNQHNNSGGNNILAAGPQINKDTKGATVISAKPQIRNLSADVTRFVPSALRVKKDTFKPKPKPVVQEPKQNEFSRGPTKDDAYMQFMREMQGLL